MTVQEFYQVIGGDYNAVITMLMAETRIRKYLGKFTQSDEFTALKDTLAAKDYKEAFRHSHSLKGMCLNLGLGDLAKTSSELCEALRKEEIVDDVDAMFEIVSRDYAKVIEAIGNID